MKVIIDINSEYIDLASNIIRVSAKSDETFKKGVDDVAEKLKNSDTHISIDLSEADGASKLYISLALCTIALECKKMGYEKEK